MTDADQFIAEYEAQADRMAKTGMYLPAEEHASCGVGLVVAVDGAPRRQVVEAGITALKAIWHRGAVDADGKTGDGAGIHVQIPVPFFQDQIARTGHEHRGELIAVGQIFLPRTDFGAQEACRTIVETEILRMGYTIYGWRHVPVNVEVLGEKANATRPEIEQILISNAKGVDVETFERELYVIRRLVEKLTTTMIAIGRSRKNPMIAQLGASNLARTGAKVAETVLPLPVSAAISPPRTARRRRRFAQKPEYLRRAFPPRFDFDGGV